MNTPKWSHPAGDFAALTDGTVTIRQGAKVRVKNGAKVVSTTAPASMKRTEIGRTQTVTVSMTSVGYRKEIATRWVKDGVRAEWHRSGSRDKDLFELAARHNVQTPNGWSDARFGADMIALGEMIGFVGVSCINERVEHLYIQESPATIEWVGAGGYYVAVSPDDVEVL